MTTLYISTEVPATKGSIADLVAKQGVECQVYDNCSAYTKKNTCFRENGFKIKLFDLDQSDFREKVWNPLEAELNLTCAHVKYRDEFRGCIRNWPKVFVESRCGWIDPNESKGRKRTRSETKLKTANVLK